MIKEKKKYRSRLRTPVKILKIILILYRTGGSGVQFARTLKYREKCSKINYPTGKIRNISKIPRGDLRIKCAYECLTE